MCAIFGGLMAILVLFDIDGTLIDAQGAGARALARALEELCGRPAELRGLDMAGKTDLQIMREVLVMNALPSEDGSLKSLVHLYIQHLRSEMARCRGKLMPGVRELLSLLSREPQVHLGLLTGNLEEGARFKLGLFGLNEFFPIGAFGDNHEDRNELLAVAIESLGKARGVWVRPQACVIIGDTPRDVACAKHNGSPCIGVATGKHSEQDLAISGADLVVPDLSATGEILGWILGIRDGLCSQIVP